MFLYYRHASYYAIVHRKCRKNYYNYNNSLVCACVCMKEKKMLRCNVRTNMKFVIKFKYAREREGVTQREHFLKS